MAAKIRGLRLVVVAFLVGTPLASFGDCTTEYAATVAAEQTRIGDCLEERARTPDLAGNGLVEERLYTWGPSVKVNRMLQDDYFCDYEFARQREFELRKFADYWSPATDKWYGFPVAPGLRELNAVDINRAHRNQLSLLYVFQGFMPKGVKLDERRASIEAEVKRFEDQAASPEKSRLAGQLAGHKQSADSRPSSIKSGRGVYFSHDPFRYVDTASGNVSALVCDLPRARSIVDLTDPTTRDFLNTRNVTYSKANDLYGAQIVPFINNPRLFDAAARGRFIIRANFPAVDPARPREQVYVDKCVINYRACRPIDLSELSLSCEDISRLIGIRKSGLDFFVDNEAPNAASLQPLFTTSETFKKDIERRARDCLGITSTDSLAELLERSGRSVFADALRPKPGD